MHEDDTAAAVRGDREAFARLVDRHVGAVCAITLAVLRDRAASEDAAQDAFITAWRRIGSLGAADRFPAWLRQIARNQARMHARASRRSRVVVDGDAVDAAAIDASAERHLLADQDAEIVRAALDVVPHDCREVLILYYREERSTAEVAAQLLLTDAAVRKRLSRARAALRAEVEHRLEPALSRSRPSRALGVAIVAALPAPTAAGARPGGWRSAWRSLGAGVVGACAAIALPLWAGGRADAPLTRAPDDPVAGGAASSPGTAASRPADDATPAIAPSADTPRDPVEQALFALARAEGLAVARCDLGGLRARGATLGQVRLVGAPIRYAELTGEHLVVVVEPDVGDYRPGLPAPVAGLGANEGAVLAFTGMRPGVVGGCTVSTAPLPPPPSGFAPRPVDPVADAALLDVIARFDAEGEAIARRAAGGDDPYTRASAMPGLSAEARALLAAWRAEWLTEVGTPVLP